MFCRHGSLPAQWAAPRSCCICSWSPSPAWPAVAERGRGRSPTPSAPSLSKTRGMSCGCAEAEEGAKATVFTLVSPSTLLLWKLRFLCIKQSLWNMSYLNLMAYLHSCNMNRWLHVSCYFISMQDSHYLNKVIKFVLSKQIRSVPADMTDLGTNDEWNGQR